MFTLNLLGGAAFNGCNGPVSGRAAHRRRVALLAILAITRGRTIGREKIVGLLWPDQTAARARHLLSESLYVLRKELGADAFVSAGDEVGLNGLVVRSDVEAFEEAIEAGELERAAQLYRGPFLDGFFLADAPEFEQWAESERARLAHAHALALECLATAREGEGRPSEAAEWWRRLMVLDPYNSRVGMRLMLALDTAGERAAALWFAKTHTAFLRDELGVEPEDDFAGVVERLRTEPVRVPRPRAPAPVAAAARVETAVGNADPPNPGESADAGKEGGSAGPKTAPPGQPAGTPATVTAPEPSGPVDPADAQAWGDAVEPVAAPEAADAGDAAGSACPDAKGEPTAAAAEEASTPPSAEPSLALTGGPAADAAGNQVAAAAPSSPLPPPQGAGNRGALRKRFFPRGTARVSGVVGLVAGIAVAMLSGSRGAAREPAAEASSPSGYDPRHIAVLYFDDHTPDGELGYLANGLTESLIHQLSQVEALEVISRNGVKPYREAAVPFDSLVSDLRVGSVVEGSVQRSGNEVRVTVQLVDAATRSHLESRTIVHPMGDLFALEDALADSVSSFLRRRLGKQVKLRRIREETRSAAAWRWVMEAEEARDDAMRFLRQGASQDAVSAARALARADSLLAAAEHADPGWVRPTVLRGWVAHRAAPLAPSPAARQDTALAFAERALARAPGDPLALELRGTLLFARATGSTDGAKQAVRLDRAEADLRAAVAAEPALASAWGTLSRLLRYRGRALESDAAARRALAEDAYLEGADMLLHRFFFNALQVADYATADSVCRQGGERFPGDWKFVQCRLLLLRADRSRPPDAASAMRLVAELDRLDPPARARSEGRAYAPVFRRVAAAAVLARSGAADSARAMLVRARREVGREAELSTSLAYDAAFVHWVLGEPDSARTLLEWAFRRRPEMREFAARDPLFRGFSLSTPPSPAPGTSRAPGSPR